MISFITPTLLPIEAATTMGVSAKESTSSIGKFGTGLKYAIAGVLRLGGNIDITVDREQYKFTAVETDIRGKAFRIVHCNGSACGFTTDLGKHWEPWQLFRELASNTLDENGSWRSGEASADEGCTVIHVSCREVEAAEHDEAVFLPERRALNVSSSGAEIFEGLSRHYYYRGIRAGSFGTDAPVTVNVTSGELSEDRLLDLGTVRTELGWSFRFATEVDEGLLLSVLSQSDHNEFWVENIAGFAVSDGLPPCVIDFMADRPKWVKHPAFNSALTKHMKRGGAGRWQKLELSSAHESLLSAGEAMCDALSVDRIPRDKAFFTRDLADNTIAVTCMDTRTVWFSTKAVLLGRQEFLCAYLEEALHAMTGFSDCTRELQNALLSMLVNSTQRDKGVAA